MSKHIESHARRPITLVAALALVGLLPGSVATAPGVTFTVTTVTDAVDADIGDGVCATAAGQCSLRAAIQESNAQPTDETILLAVPPPAPGTSPVYALTIAGRDEDAAATGDLDITDDVEIVGQSTPPATIDGLGGDRVLDVFTCAACEVVLADLDVVNGSASHMLDPDDRNGAGIQNIDGALSLFNVGVFDSTAQGSGGGIANFDGEVSLFDGSIVEGNTAVTGGLGNGGGIANVSGLLTLDDAWVLDNHAVCGSGAGIFNAGTLSVDDVLFDGNVADCAAGAIANAAGGSATIVDSTFSANLADDGAGIGNAGSATVRRSTFANNDAFFAYGGAILNSGTLVLENSTLSGNHAERRGGGIYAAAGTATLTNVTLAFNEASNRRGAVHPELAGGGIYGGGGAVTLKNTILAFNTRSASGASSASNCAGGAVGSAGRNLETSATCALGPADAPNANPLLGPLQANGGLTFTHALQSGSPAIDAGDNAGCPATDQRGGAFTRPNDGDGDGASVCDIGAFEHAAVAPSPPGGGSGGGGSAIPDLRLVGSVQPAVASLGTAVGVTLEASTPDDSPAEKVTVTVTVPAGLRVDGATATRGSGCGAVVDGVMSCNLDFLSGGAAKVGTIRLGVTVVQAGEHALVATLKSASGERNPADNTVELRIATPPPAPQPPASPGPAAPAGRTLTGTRRADVLRGGAGPDVLDGRGGNDRLFGGAGHDRLLGGAGNDRLVGGPGRDSLLGGPGVDRIEARDGMRDRVRCGAGRLDVAIVDRQDAVGSDCEVVRRR